MDEWAERILWILAFQCSYLDLLPSLRGRSNVTNSLVPTSSFTIHNEVDNKDAAGFKGSIKPRENKWFQCYRMIPCSLSHLTAAINCKHFSFLVRLSAEVCGSGNREVQSAADSASAGKQGSKINPMETSPPHLWRMSSCMMQRVLKENLDR